MFIAAALGWRHERSGVLKVYSSIVHEHNALLLIFGGVICLLAAFTAFSLFQKAEQALSRRYRWVIAAAVVMGLGIWAAQFTFILAYQTSTPFSYDLAKTVHSMLIAIAVAGMGWKIALDRRLASAPLGGAVIGLGVAAMHFVGMAAVQTNFRISWDPMLLLVSTALCVAVAAAALSCDRHKTQDPAWVAAPLLAFAICLQHFVAMTAVSVRPPIAQMIPAAGLDEQTLAIALTAASLLIMMIGASNALADRRSGEAELIAARERAMIADEMLRGSAERDRLTAEVRAQADIITAALDNMAQGLSMYDAENRLVIHNKRYAELYGIPPDLLQAGTSFLENYDQLVDAGVLPPMPEFLSDDYEFRPDVRGDAEIVLQNGRVILFHRRPLPGGGWVATHEDVTEARKASEQIAYLAAHDGLTSLPNRTTFAARLEASSRKGQSFAIHTIDLDRFKEVNDTLGHPVGDQILRETAARLRKLAASDDLVTRLGGDEFAILQTNPDGPSSPSDLAARIIARLGEPFEFEGHTVTIGASVGISLAPKDGASGDELLKKSDLALYCAKDESRGTYRFFEPGMDSRLLERRQLEADLRTAIQGGQFEVYYQPLLDMRTGKISCFEALVRWHHPLRGLIQPSEFIATAEDSGLIIPIGEWVLRQACHDAAGWPSDVRVAVNLSSAQFKRGDIVAMVVSALASAGLDPKRLELEITESVLLHDEAWVQSMLKRLTALGVGIAMDDFGTGYSSLSYLRSFPFTKIKIDRSFISDLVGTTDAFAIVQATIHLSHKLGMQIVAEGVETAEQMQILAAEGCNQAQGYHVSQPVPLAEIANLLSFYNCERGDPVRAAR
jgi:diguanylate cyclase (GGDEF)-like protein